MRTNERMDELNDLFVSGGSWTCKSGRHVHKSIHGLEANGWRSVRCRECHIEKQRIINKRNQETIDSTFANGVVLYTPPAACELCGGRSNQMQRDHDHTTNNFRGWLCIHCNITMGKVDTIGIDKIIAWLERGK